MRLTQSSTTITNRRKFRHLPTRRPTSFQVIYVDSRHVSKNEALNPKFARNCLPYTAVHENVCGYATMSFFAVCWTCWSCCVSILFFQLKSGWNGIEMDIENGCKKLGRWKLVRTNRGCVGDASVVVVCSWWQKWAPNAPLNSAMVWGFVEVSSPLRNLARNLVFARNASYPLSHYRN